MYDYQLLDRIVTLEKKLGMPATFPNWRGPVPNGTAVEFDGALSVPFGCAILKNQPEGQDGDMMLVLDADEVPDVLGEAAEGIIMHESWGMCALRGCCWGVGLSSRGLASTLVWGQPPVATFRICQ